MTEQTYQPTEYLQFTAGRWFRIAQASLGVLVWPVIWPLAMLSRVSDIVFRSMSELLSVVPYFPGVIVRYEFYRFALTRCGRNVVFEFGSVFIYADVEIGSNVLIGRYNVIHHCDVRDYSLIGERCTFLSGSRQHSYQRHDLPMALQGGSKKRIRIGPDCWIGSHSVVMDNVGEGSIVGAGSVISKPVADYSIVVGNPQREIGTRR